MSTYNAGVVTAYGAAVRGGYTGTYEEFCELMANTANYAASAQAAADRAESAIYDEVDFVADGDGVVTLSNERTQHRQDMPGDALTYRIKQAMLYVMSKVAFIDDDGQKYYDLLRDAMYQDAELESISASFTPTRSIYDDWQLNDLRPYLVVTATYDNGAQETVDLYEMSGSIAVGTSTITVSYGGKTTTFDVTVSAPLYPFTTGTHTFTSPAGTIQVTNGNTGVITASTANSNDTHANFSKLSSNTTACNSTNNYAKDGSTCFSVSSGSVVRAKVIINSYENCPSSMKIGSALRAFSGSTLLTQMLLVPDTILTNLPFGYVFEATDTFANDTDIGCVGMWFGMRNSSVQASINVSYIIYVDDVRYV